MQPSIGVALVVASFLLNVWAGQRVARRVDDPAFAERWVAHNARALVLCLTAMLIATTVCGLSGWMWLPWYLGYVASLYPARRRVLGETWGLAAYVSFNLRILVAFGGFWYLLAFVPLITTASGRFFWPVSAGLLALLGFWASFSHQVMLRVLRATPLQRAELEEPFARVLANARCAPPSVYRAGFAGGVFANALALPSTRGARVVFFDSLLEQLDSAESAAIFAHEVAHLEHYDTRRLRRWGMWMQLLVLAACLCAPVAHIWAPRFEFGVSLIWFAGIVAFGLVRRSLHQRHEQESDLRALELCGDGEALIRGLTKLHTLARVPRRLLSRVEAAASHPSLARRIRAIRSAMGETATTGAAQAAFEAVCVADAAATGRFAVLDAEQVRWLENVPEGTPHQVEALLAVAGAVETTPYARLHELLVRTGVLHARLIATSVDGRPYALRLAPEDVGRVQAVLNEVDTRMASLPPSRPRSGLVAAWCAIALLLPASTTIGVLFAPVWVGLVCALRPRRSSLGALGATALGTLVLLFAWPHPTRFSAVSSLLLIAGALLTALPVVLSLRGDRKRDTPALGAAWEGVLLFGLPALAFYVCHAFFAFEPAHLHAAVANMPSGVLMSLALCGALATSDARPPRGVALIAGVIALAQLGIGSARFPSGAASDPLAARAPALRVTKWSPVADEHATVPAAASRLRLSPAGGAFSVVIESGAEVEEDADDADEGTPLEVVYGRWRGPLRSVQALDFAFLDESHAVSLAGASQGAALNTLSLDDGSTAALAPADALPAQWFALDPGGGRYCVFRYAGDEALVRTCGTVGAPQLDRTRWTLPDTGFQAGVPMRGDDLLWMRPPRAHLKGKWGRLRAFVLGQHADDGSTDLSVLSAQGRVTEVVRSMRHVRCLVDRSSAGRYLCGAWRGAKSVLWEFDARTRAYRPVAQGELGWAYALRGAELASMDDDDERVRYVRLDLHREWRWRLKESECTREIALGDRHLGLLESCAGHTQVTLVRKPDAD